MGYKVEVSSAFINHPTDENVLKYGTQAVLWREDDAYNRVSESEKAEEAFAALVESLRIPNRQPFISRYTDEEVRQVIKPDDPKWSLSIYSPNMRMDDFPDRITYKTHPKAIVGEFQFIKSKSGDCKVLHFEGRNDFLKIQPLDLITLWYGGKAIFYGPAVEHYDYRNPSPSRIKISGPRENLDGYLINEPIQGRLSIQGFVKKIFEQFIKGPVTYNPNKVQVPDLFLELDHLPVGLPVSSIFDQLVLKLPDGRWGVDAEGELFLHSQR